MRVEAVAHEHDVTEVLRDLSERVTRLLGVSGTGVSLVRGGQVQFVASHDDAIARLERVQEARQEGPCLDAVHIGRPVLVERLADRADQWPHYAAQAAELRLVSVAAIPMQAGAETIGALDAYHTAPVLWGEPEVATCRMLADLATSYVLNASELDRQRRTNEQLQEALDSRIIIEQAKGMIAAVHGVNVDVAFVLLRRYARNHRTSLRDVARDVVNSGLRP